jgi:hypothetical protein
MVKPVVTNKEAVDLEDSSLPETGPLKYLNHQGCPLSVLFPQSQIQWYCRDYTDTTGCKEQS